MNIRSTLILLCIFTSVVYSGQQFTWLNNNFNYFDTTNWNPIGSPSSADDISISKNDSYVIINNSSTVTNFIMNSPKNATMVFVQQASLKAQYAQVQGGSTLFVETSSQTTPALQVSVQTNLLSNLYFKSGFVNASNLGFVNATVQFGNGVQKLATNFASLYNTAMTQNSGASTNFAAAARFTLSSLTSNNAIFNSNNAGVISTMHSSNLTFIGSTFTANNYFLLETVKMVVKQSNFYITKLNLVQDASFSAENSLISFDQYFTTISTAPVKLKNFCILQSTAATSQMVASYNSILYFENTIFDMKGQFILRDNAQLIFADLILPIRPLTIKLFGNAKIKYQSTWFGGGLSFMKQASNLDVTPETTTTTSTPTPTPTPTSTQSTQPNTQSNITVPTTISTLSFELNDNSVLEVTNNILNNINIINNGEGTILFNNNVTLSNVTIEGSAIASGSLELNKTTINGNVINSGNLFGSGTINGGLTNTGNIGSAFDVNQIVIQGAFSSSSASTIGILINSPTSYSQINITGSFNFLGTVNVRINQDALIPNQVYKIINYPGQSSYSFNNVTVVFTNSPSSTTEPLSYSLISNADNSLSLKINERETTQSKSSNNNNLAIILTVSGAAFLSILVATAFFIYKKRSSTLNIDIDQSNQHKVDNIEMVSVEQHFAYRA
ncbi:hypothetical protein PPL_10324 [Heterostelium album PN500]|uniref:Uncharacterized protein n=1 Tax=Heterostelium pallidum (strain ATCC 26659 / Pp 5 / PN500) TaxID=670386 RepID=D3BQ04_HETP5|nr:hypothetical protein PPL_10324 [Heterostelium album PN500]EFA76555.1 hypothetical protein PPL_10324 [Heterostelium album PN500]|eukprot:XP_020428687.1 hypothetical protein PPL_10324 [Heterostelium album PN500]